LVKIKTWEEDWIGFYKDPAQATGGILIFYKSAFLQPLRCALDPHPPQ
jgi:hypothetical protein